MSLQTPSNMYWQVSPQESGMQLSAFIAHKHSSRLSAKKVKQAIDSGFCTINSCTVTFSSTRVGSGDVVGFFPPEKIEKLPFTDAAILFEDDNFIIINKPAGVLSTPHSISGWISHNDHNVGHLTANSYSDIRLVHRLDIETSGALLLAKNVNAEIAALALFKERRIDKAYFAIVDGVPRKHSGRIKNYLGPIHRIDGQTICGKLPIARSGKEAITEWHQCHSRVTAEHSYTHMLCIPKTGRMHQIRVHMSDMGHPILGDRQYGKIFTCRYNFPRTLLHAQKLSFIHPFTNKKIAVEAPLTPDIDRAFKELFGFSL